MILFLSFLFWLCAARRLHYVGSQEVRSNGVHLMWIVVEHCSTARPRRHSCHNKMKLNIHCIHAGVQPSWEDAAWGGLQKGQQTAKAQPVFARLEGDCVISKSEAAAAVE